MKIVIVGSGAIGRLFGAFLAKGGHEVILVDVDQRVVDEINHSGIGLMELGESNPDTVQQFSVQAVSDPSIISGCDLILLTVKSHATLSATRSVLHLISEASPVLTLQTGLGNIEVLEKLVPSKHIIAAFTFMSATALGNSRVRHGGMGKTYLGELNGELSPRLKKVSQLFNDCGLKNQMVHRIIGRLWCKVIVYSAINPVSSILRIPNGNLLSRMESVTLMKTLVDEGRRVAEASAIDLVYPDLYELLFNACKQSSNNLSSMLQDLLNDRLTEIDAQNGALCHFAEEKGISTPTQCTMVQLVKLLEKWKPGTIPNL
ncbi:MAG: 2-dehydropantoate 2-reductase [Thermodesulfobacteriota bacterium]|nr:2-dehydropantoate 2-reductase [Thermodesulfobacteriota bacterium]